LKVVKFKFKEVDPFFNINRPEDLKWAEKLF
jgi:molybdopterin-guanine dinucleotide biosynthesis protein A